jgi:histidyl-tRNA synthetase
MNKLQPVRGTHDLLPEEFAKFLAIQKLARRITASYGFAEIATPIFEFTDVFARTMGETSDVVNKEMYTFKDRGDESITLRPEFTAGIVRSFISNGLQQSLPCKFFSTGPVFRYERPQKGRQRQFHQLNVEYLGGNKFSDDYTVIAMAEHLLRELEIKSELHINSLGCTQSRQNYRSALVEYFDKYKNELSDDSKIRLDKNPLRILDSKNETDIKISADAPKLADYLSDASKNSFDSLKNMLSKLLDITFTENPKLVRGLDYYNDVVFEFKSSDLGAKDTILAGGRYDGLVKLMGGPETPAVGWGAGIERLMLASNFSSKNSTDILVIAGSDELRTNAEMIGRNLRKKQSVEVITQKDIGKALKYANKINAAEAYIYAGDEAAKNIVTVKNLVSGEQKTLPISDFS